MASFKFSLALASLLIVVACSGGNCQGSPVNQIVGGTESVQGEFPFVVLLEMANKHTGQPSYCGGTIIHEQYILTAAHCVNDLDLSKSLAGIGCHNRSDCRDSIGFQHIMVHPKFGNKQNDIALVRLEREIQFDKLTGMGPIKIVPLALYDVYAAADERTMLIVAGWGRYFHNSSLDKHANKIRYKSNVLKKVSIPLIPLSVCKNSYQHISDKNICAGTQGSGQCRGDSGGPLLQVSPSEGLVQVGVVSRSISCATEAGGVFTRVAPFYAWIRSCLEQRSECGAS